MSIPACMGGWCQRRDSCARHHAEDRQNASERLCEPGTTDAWEPVRTATDEHRAKLAADPRFAVWAMLSEAA